MRYSVSRRKPENRVTHVCKNCGVDFPHKKSTTNKFCSRSCSGEWSRNDSLRKFLAGEVLSESTIRRCVLDYNGRMCCLCMQDETWNGKPLTLQVDHIDGNSDNNSVNNLRVLCPNCHTQTDNYGPKGAGSRYKKMRKRNLAVRKSKGYVE